MQFDNILDNKLAASFVLLFALGFGAAGAQNFDLQPEINNPDTVSTAGHEESFDYVDIVKVYKNGELVVKTHNALMEGEDAVRQLSTGEGPYNYSDIALGNGDAPTDASSSLDQEFSTLGLSPQTADLDYIAGTDQNEWNLTATFTATGSATINTTAVKSPTAPSDIDYYAGAAFGRNLNVVDGDQLTVEWNFNVQ